MAAEICGTGGARTWNLVIEEDKHRTYRIVYRVKVGPGQGPTVARTAPGLPSPGDSWNVDNDSFPDAKCLNTVVITPVIDDGEFSEFWDLEFVFSTRGTLACTEDATTNPLDVPQKLSGSFVRYTREATHDRYGNPIISSSWEPLRGPQVEFDVGHPTVRVEQNVANLQFDLCNQMMNTLNRYPLWGFPRRSIKLSDFNWVKLYRENCIPYYVRIFEFEILFDWRQLPAIQLIALMGVTPLVAEVVAELSTYPPYKDMDAKADLQAAVAALPPHAIWPVSVPNREFEGWDRDVLDEGYKVLNGHWAAGVITDPEEENTRGEWVLDPVNPGGFPSILPNPGNPSHFKRFTDRDGNYVKAVLNGAGEPYDPDTVPTHWYDNGLNIGPRVDPPDPGTGTAPANLNVTYVAGGFFKDSPLGYDFAVTAVNAAGQESARSNIDAFTPTDAARTAKLDWDAVSGAVGYRIYRKAFNNQNGGIWTLVGFAGAGGQPGTRRIEKYDESDFSKLGIPTAL